MTLAWDANPETDIASYKLSYGTASGIYPNVINVGLNTATSVTGLVDGTDYFFTVSAINSAGVQSPNSSEISYVAVSPVLLPSNTWTVNYVDSEDRQGYPAVNAFDGDPNTYWHTEWRLNAPPPPHEIQINLGSNQSIDGFRYLPRQDTGFNGNVGQYEFLSRSFHPRRDRVWVLRVEYTVLQLDKPDAAPVARDAQSVFAGVGHQHRARPRPEYV